MKYRMTQRDKNSPSIGTSQQLGPNIYKRYIASLENGLKTCILVPSFAQEQKTSHK